jgi:DNA-binding MarR family transcriptional regulator
MRNLNAVEAIAPEVRAPDAGEAVAGLDAITRAKLWRNPCWLAFRFNYLALRYNEPLYGWVRRRFGLSRPEFAVIYTLGLHDGALARDIALSYGFPENTLSRAVAKLARLGLLRREPDPGDARTRRLTLTTAGRDVLTEATPRFVEEELRLLEALTAQEQATLSRFLARVVARATQRPADDPLAPAEGEGPCASST